MIEDKIKVNMLLDFYDSLLTKRQLEVLNLYYRRDYSMIEIAENLDISKAAVSDLIRRTVKQLDNYENKLHNLANFNKRQILYEELSALQNNEINDIIEKLKESE